MRKKTNLFLGLLTAVLSAAMTLPASSANAATPMPAPTNLHALFVSDTSATLSWLSEGISEIDVVERRVNGVWREFARNSFRNLPLTGLTPGLTYTFRVYSIPFPGYGYSTSPRTAPMSFTTLSGPDSVPPAKPAAPTFSGITTTAVNVFWPETTDNVQVTGYYLQQLIGGTWTTIRTITNGVRLQTVGGLSANTSYTFAVIAFDARGNNSARSDPGTVTTLANTATVTCRVQLIAYNPGFQATVSVMNTTTAPVSNWNIQFTAALTTAVGPAFNGTLTRNGTAVTITPAFYYATLNPGTTANIGFSGNSSGPTFNPPTGFTAAGIPCTIV